MKKHELTYAVVIENAGANFSAYVPDLPGCVSTGRTVDETLRNIREAIEFHLEGLLENGDPIPQPTTIGREVHIQIAA